MSRYDLAVDFMDMTNDGWWTRIEDARPGFAPTVGNLVVIGCDDADPAVARIVTIDAAGNIAVEALRGSVESHHDLLTPA